jgi:EAL domain-containing protein (putative c-di-GMP-specific phosphodiesterase class I)
MTLNIEDKRTLELRTIRTILIRQIKPENDDSVIYEIFARLNSGGENLKPQELRASVYHSDFIKMLTKLNLDKTWRKLSTENPDSHMRDIEIILRGFVMMIKGGEGFSASVAQSLNKFCNEAMGYQKEQNEYLKSIFEKFMDLCKSLPDDAFRIDKKFNVSLYEAVFTVICSGAYRAHNLELANISSERLSKLKSDEEFLNSFGSHSSNKSKIELRLNIAKKLLL